MSAPGHRYRIRSPLNSPRERSPSNNSSSASTVHPPPNLDASDDATDSDSDTAVDDSGREGSSTPNSRETSVPPPHEPPPFAGLRDEVFPEQALAATIPYEIILNIFRYLEPFGIDHHNCLYVCKAWAKCAVENVWFRPSIKHVTTFYKFASVLTAANRKFSTLFPYAQFVRRLNLLNVARELHPRHLAMLAECTQLERLTMGGAFLINDSAVEAVIPGFKRLLALDLSLVDLGDDGLCAVAESCRLLQGLNVSQCSRLTDKSIQAVAENCHNLRRVLSLLVMLTKLKLSGCGLITDAPLTILAQNARYLLELDLTNCISVAGSFLPVPTASKSNNLLSRRISTESFTPNKTLPVLRELRLGGCASIQTNSFVPRFASQEWASLRILDLTQCTRLQDTDLATIIAHAPRIRNLVLYKCISLTDRGILSLVSLGKYLHYLHLGHCIEITDMSVIQLAKHCTRLRYLDLASCVRITDLSCLELGLHLEKLKRVGLVKCTNIGDTGIVSLVRGRANVFAVLERIHLSYCHRLTLRVCPCVLCADD